MQFEGITLGEPLAALTPRLGDPVQIASTGKSVIWRYLEGGGGYYLDLLVKNNTATSVTVVQRMQGARYTDPHGVSFGTTSDQVRAKLGAPWRVTTNSDDGSVDLWFRELGASVGAPRVHDCIRERILRRVVGLGVQRRFPPVAAVAAAEAALMETKE
jgi:hypothetical protein